MYNKLIISFYGGIMGDFFHKYGYSIVKMFVNQFALSLFGSTLAMATLAAKNDTLTILVITIGNRKNIYD